MAMSRLAYLGSRVAPSQFAGDPSPPPHTHSVLRLRHGVRARGRGLALASQQSGSFTFSVASKRSYTICIAYCRKSLAAGRSSTFATMRQTLRPIPSSHLAALPCCVPLPCSPLPVMRDHDIHLADDAEAEPGSLINNLALDTLHGWDSEVTIPTTPAYHRPAPLSEPSPIVPPAISPGWVPQPLSLPHAHAPAGRSRGRAAPFAARGGARKHGGRGRTARTYASPPSIAAALPFDVAAVFAATVVAPAAIDDQSASSAALDPYMPTADCAGTAPVASAPSNGTSPAAATTTAASSGRIGTPQPPVAAPAAARLPEEEAGMAPTAATASVAAAAASPAAAAAAPLKPQRKRARKGEGLRKATAAERRRKLGANKELGSKPKALRIKWSEPWVKALVLHLRAARHPWEVSRPPLLHRLSRCPPCITHEPKHCPFPPCTPFQRAQSRCTSPRRAWRPCSRTLPAPTPASC
jgi:hypothetical protein